MNDFQRKVKMTTFIDNKTVLLQLNYRYMVFDHNGKFISNVHFSDIDYTTAERREIPTQSKASLVNSMPKGSTAPAGIDILNKFSESLVATMKSTRKLSKAKNKSHSVLANIDRFNRM